MVFVVINYLLYFNISIVKSGLSSSKRQGMENGENIASSWSLKEEVNLLEAMVVCGQDWLSISKRCAGRSPDECERHYYNYFIDNPRLTDLSNLLTKTREASYNSRKFLCPSLLSSKSVCGCGDNECDNSSSISKIEEENSTTNLGAFEKNTCDSFETRFNNRISEAYSDECKEWGDSSFGTSTSHQQDNANCSVSTAKYNENRKPLPENSYMGNIKQEVKFDCVSTITTEVLEINHSSSPIDSCRFIHMDSDYKTDTKLESGSVSELFPSKPLQRQVIAFEPSVTEQPSDYSLESSTENVEFHEKRAGFDAKRTEFDIEYDNGAEEALNMLSHELIQDDEDVDNHLITELSISVVKGYMYRLKERHQRKSLVQRFGLLDYSKIANYMKTVEATFGKRFAKRLVLLKRLFSSEDYDDFIKGYQRQNQLKSQLSTLFSYRERGITTLAASSLYEEMSKMRNESNRQIQAIPIIRQLENGEAIFGNTFRRPAPPIAIHEMPGYESLEKEEAEFCSVQRIPPKSFLEYKTTLISECEKRKCLKLAHARPLLKIDVNKTRKLYDLLLNKNLIWKDDK